MVDRQSENRHTVAYRRILADGNADDSGQPGVVVLATGYQVEEMSPLPLLVDEQTDSMSVESVDHRQLFRF